MRYRNISFFFGFSFLLKNFLYLCGNFKDKKDETPNCNFI